jgi:hypothetical protein
MLKVKILGTFTVQDFIGFASGGREPWEDFEMGKSLATNHNHPHI